MNIYLKYLIKNFGGYNLDGSKMISDLIQDYDITNIQNAYKEYANNINKTWQSVERSVRYYIKHIASKDATERILECRCRNNKNFTSQEFLKLIKLRAEESVKDDK